ncbi:MAG: hypothetical protein GXO27_06500 [Chlorobi bacterium]|nr:hypothetical protein [Chlorobiota bacterium]
MERKFEFPKKLKTISLALVALGVLVTIIGFFTDKERTLSSLLYHNYFFLTISLGAAFWLAIQFITEAGWSAAFKRVPEGMFDYLLYGFLIMLIVFTLGIKVIYPWADPQSHFTPFELKFISHHLHEKAGYLNIPFFFIRVIVYFILWYLVMKILIKYSKKEDEDKENAMTWFRKQWHYSRVYIFVWALTFIFASIDWMMSIEPMWYSHIFPVKEIISAFVHSAAAIILVIIYLYRKGYYPFMNPSHWHDLSKYVFMGSILFAYAWYFQYMLIWYGNIPEETEYFYIRRFHFSEPLFIASIILNFGIPFSLTLWNKMARNYKILGIAAFVFLLGKYLEHYLMVYPDTVKHPVYGWIELGMLLGFIGLFVYVTFSAMARRKYILPVNHPYLEESLFHHIPH